MAEVVKRNWILDLAEGRTNRIYYRLDMGCERKGFIKADFRI